MSNPLKILIIGDEEKALELLGLNLEHFGFEIITALGGVIGSIKAFNEKPDVIILDISMFEMMGWEVCKKLKANAKTQNIPIILLTTFSGPKEHEKAKALNVNEFLIKPVDPESLALTLNKFSRLIRIKQKV